jgi:D-beta-D-heptose 7-phosphate kinase/D-beta-D-heptose 1-phosphate adenosyltransferase
VKKIGIASGYFNPLHAGHLDYLEAAKEQCEFLVVIVNNDIQVGLKKSIPFMPLIDRIRIVKALGCVDMTLASISTDETVISDLEVLDATFNVEGADMCSLRFFNSGDRDAENTPEFETCSKLGIQLRILDQPKVESSSSLIDRIVEKQKKSP